jgi:malonyl-CoA decarboxylase
MTPATPSQAPGFSARTAAAITHTWHRLFGREDSARATVAGPIRPDLPGSDADNLREQMRLCLDSRSGEVTARAQTVELGKIYISLSETGAKGSLSGREKFLHILAEDFDLDSETLLSSVEALAKAGDKGMSEKLRGELRSALVTPRSTILRQFLSLPDGCKFLVDMRADLLALLAKEPKAKGAPAKGEPKAEALKSLDNDMKDILSKVFDVGLLKLERITWDSSADLIEKLMEYEAVHKVSSWRDIKNRLDADRRVYAFFHPNMPGEPLIILHVALTKGISGNVQAILDVASPVLDVKQADTAIFYSISNAQPGLAGIPFGNFLIKRVVGEELMRDMPHIDRFSTLSPIPGLRGWLDPLLAKEDEALLVGGAHPLFAEKDLAVLRKITANGNAVAGLRHLLASDWQKDAKLSAKLQPIMEALCAHYLLREKRSGSARDPVAHFHLTNGARIKRINWLGDTSENGMKQSAGLMVNYLYDLDHIADNHEHYASEGIIASSKGVRAMLTPLPSRGGIGKAIKRQLPFTGRDKKPAALEEGTEKKKA